MLALGPVALLLAAVLVLPGCGCGREPPPPAAPEAGGTLRVAVLEPFDYLTPVRAIRPATHEFMVHITPPLGRVNEQGGIQWLMARRVSELGPGLTFPLRHATWEDGHPVTARDFVLTTQVMLHPGAPGQERTRFGLVKEVVALDDTTLFFELLQFMPSRQKDALLMPLPAHVLGDSPDPRHLYEWPITRKPISCGPFRVEESTTASLILSGHDGSGFRPPYLDRVEVRALDVEEALREFRAGRLDVVDDVPARDLQAVRRVRGARTVALVGASYVFMGWNLRDARFASLEVRRAAALSVDLARLLRELTHGQGDPARGPLVPSLGILDTTAVLARDPGRARRLLEQDGWRDRDRDGVREREGARLAFHILVPEGDDLRRAAAAAVARDLSRVGMQVQVRALELEEFVLRLESGRFEAYMGRLFPQGAEDLERAWHSGSTDQLNFGGFADSVVDSLLQRLRHEDDESLRNELLARLQQRIYAAQPCLFLFQDPRFAVFSDRVQGAKPSVLSTFWNLPEWWIPRARQRRRGPRGTGGGFRDGRAGLRQRGDTRKHPRRPRRRLPHAVEPHIVSSR